MAFLPVQAANRSQRVRIGGKTILPRITSYIDLGSILPVTAPTLTFTKTGEESEGRGLKKSVFFAWGVTAVDASGNETPLALTSGETEAGAETEKAKNFAKVTFTPVAHAVKYNVFRTGVGKTGFATAALALAATPKLIATIAASSVVGATEVYVDKNGLTGSEEGTTEATGGVTNVTFYNTSKTAWSTFHELQNHLAIGALIVVGNITPNPNDWVPYVAGDWAVTLGVEEVKVAKAKELLQRSTGLVREVTAATPAAKKAATAGDEIYTYIVYNTLTNKVESVEGAQEVEKTLSQQAAIEVVAAKLTKYQQPLLVVRTTHTVTTPEIISGRENVVRVAV
jgi:hypothetical protein